MSSATMLRLLSLAERSVAMLDNECKAELCKKDFEPSQPAVRWSGCLPVPA